MYRRCLTLLSFCSLATAQEVVIELKDPIVTKNCVYCEQGGVLNTEDLRIQAKNISYFTNEAGEKIVKASGDLFIIYRKKYFLADSMTFNLNQQQGVLQNANGFAEGVFFGGKEIALHEDGTLDADTAYVTTSDSTDPEWSVQAKTIHMDEKYQINAKKVSVNVAKYPILDLNHYSMGVNSRFKKKEARIKSRVLWEKGQGPMLFTRLAAIDTEQLKLFLRGEYRMIRGGGGAMELDYATEDKKQSLQLRNFYAYDSFSNDKNPNKLKSRYRLQGIYKGKSLNDQIELFARWDALSDKNMRSDFPTQLFELSTLERTEGYIKAYYDSAYSSLYTRPRINQFRGFKQELPTLTVAVKPLYLGNTQAVLENYLRFGYLEYSYADNLEHLVPSFRSGRLETRQSLYRSFQWGPITFFPKADFKGIFYSNNPKGQTIGQALVHYNFNTFASFEKPFENYLHLVEPYANFSGYTEPTASNEEVYIFSIQDGYHHLSELKIGIKNQLSTLKEFTPLPTLTNDLYAYNFFHTQAFNQIFPKIGMNTCANFSKMTLATFVGWNFQDNLLDFANLKLGCTLNDYFAFTAEIRHRGDYYWRKNNYTNNLLDVSRSRASLENSPLSDHRTTFRCKWQLQIAPLWTLRILNHVGWRPNKPFYHESKIELQTLISNTARLNFSYTRTVRTNQFTLGINLI